MGLCWWLSSKEFACNAGDAGDTGSSLGWEDPLEQELAIHSSVLAWKNSMDREAWWATVQVGRKESDTTEHMGVFC